MMLKVTPKGASKAKEAEEAKKQASKRGKRSKNKGSSYERDIAKKFKAKYNAELMRTPQSGGFAKKSSNADDFRGDIVPVDNTIDLKLHIECKNHQTWSLPSWFKQAEEDCPKGKVPVVIFHKHNTSKDYIALSLEDFMNLVQRDTIITARKEK